MTNPTLSKLGDLQITLARAGRICTITGAELAKLVDRDQYRELKTRLAG